MGWLTDAFRKSRPGRDVIVIDSVKVAGVPGVARLTIPRVTARAHLNAMSRTKDPAERQRLTRRLVATHTVPSPVDTWRGPYAERLGALSAAEWETLGTMLADGLTEELDGAPDDA